MRSAAVIIKDGMVLLIHRFRDGIEFFVLPGGTVEEGETLEQAAIREVKEETSLDVKIDKKLWQHLNIHGNDVPKMHHYFLMKGIVGEIELGGEEKEINSKENSFVLEWHDLKKLSELPIKPDFAKEKLIEEFSK